MPTVCFGEIRHAGDAADFAQCAHPHAALFSYFVANLFKRIELKDCLGDRQPNFHFHLCWRSIGGA